MTINPPLSLDPTTDPWEKQPGETPKKYSRFLVYRDKGLTRTLTEASKDLALSYSYVRTLAVENRWQERAAAWDVYQRQQYSALMDVERRRAAEEDARVLRVMTGMIGQALPNMQPSKMTWTEFTRLVETTMRLRRSLFGDPTDTIAVTGPGGDPLSVQVSEFASLNPEERSERLTALSAAVTRRASALSGDDEDEYQPRSTVDGEDDQVEQDGDG